MRKLWLVVSVHAAARVRERVSKWTDPDWSDASLRDIKEVVLDSTRVSKFQATQLPIELDDPAEEMWYSAKLDGYFITKTCRRKVVVKTFIHQRDFDQTVAIQAAMR